MPKLVIALGATVVLAALLGYILSRRKRGGTTLLPGDGACTVAAVGEAQYLPAYEALFGKRNAQGFDVETTVRLEHSPQERAIAIYSGTHKLGFLGETDAASLAPLLGQLWKAGKTVQCKARVRGGYDDGQGATTDFQLKLDIAKK